MEAGASAGGQGARRRAKAEQLRVEAKQLLDRADGLDRTAEHWEKGEAGERLVGAELDRLRSQGWVVMHDIRWPGRRRANIDHVAIGPGGILVVDAKNWSGTVSVSKGRLRQNGFARDREVASVEEAARAVSGLLDLPWALHVVPVLCSAGSQTLAPTRLGSTTVLSASAMVEWATALPAQLLTADVAGLSEYLSGVVTSASTGNSGVAAARSGGYGASAPRPDPRVKVRRGRSSSGRRSRRRARRRGNAASELLLRLALLAAVLVAGPKLLQLWIDHGEDIVRPALPSAADLSPSADPQVFDRCRALRVDYPVGVRSAGTRNDGRKLTAQPVVNGEVARANAALDRDKDGLVCELSKGPSRSPVGG